LLPYAIREKAIMGIRLEATVEILAKGIESVVLATLVEKEPLPLSCAKEDSEALPIGKIALFKSDIHQVRSLHSQLAPVVSFEPPKATQYRPALRLLANGMS
jgi:hypothetical protein